MGEVFLAKDTRLDRRVAVKVLPQHFLHDRDRLARFEREARVLASLNHPGIGAIHGLEESDGQRFLILEFIDGETLADRLTRGPIPIGEALAIASQLAAALEAAHEKGVIHRDLKPGNLMVTAEGVVKVLDFGLARAEDSGGNLASRDPSRADQAATATSPALVDSPTMPGAILGTAGYMAPEQVRGKAIDKRVDIFAFGCILFEMLVGKPPFLSETVAESLAATLHKDPELDALPRETPRRIRDLVASCLAKERARRLRDIGDAQLEIDRSATDSADAPASARDGVSRRLAALGVAAATAVGALGAALAVYALRAPGDAIAERPVLRTTLALPRGEGLVDSARAHEVSPDGTRVVLALSDVDGNSPSRLVLRDLAHLGFDELPGTEGANFPFWSPDGLSIAFFADQKLKRVDLADGFVRTLCDAPAGRGGSWGSQGTIVFAPSAVGPLSIVNDSGGKPEPVTQCATPTESHRLPQMLPDGRSFVYVVTASVDQGVFVFDARTNQSRFLLESPAEALFVAPDFLVYPRDENLFAQKFDLDRLVLAGSPVPLASAVHYSKARNFTNASIAAQGTLVYQRVQTPPLTKLEWMDREGKRTTIPIESLAMDPLDTMKVDASGRRATLVAKGARDEVATEVIDLERGVRMPVGKPDAIFVSGNAWSPEAGGVICSTYEDGVVSIVEFYLAGGSRTLLAGEPGVEYWPGSVARSGTGNTLLFQETKMLDKQGDIMMLDLAGEAKPKPFIRTTGVDESGPLVSPAGDCVAYSASSGAGPTTRLMVASYPTAGVPIQVSAASVRLNYCWLDNDELCWTDESDRVWSARVASKDGAIEIGAPRQHFGGTDLGPSTRILDYDIARSRFLVATQVTPRDSPDLVVLSDWRPSVAAARADER